MEQLHHTQQKTIDFDDIKPMHLGESIVIFGLPALLTFASFNIWRPWLETVGATPFEAFATSLIVPLALMFAAAIVATIQDYNITTLLQLGEAFRTRLRYPRITFKAILQGVGFYIAMLIVGMPLSLLGRMLVLNGIVPVPNHLPALLDPTKTFDQATLLEFAGGWLEGNWEIILLVIVLWFFNTIGEELWWRGYVLPRQEMAFGRWAWLVHGLLWCGFHVFKYWDLLSVLPVALLIAFAGFRTKDNWVPTVAHFLGNALLYGIMIAAVLGV